MRPKSIVLAPAGTQGRGNDPTDPEAIVRVLFEKSPLLIYIADLDFKIVLINRALREVTGYDTSDCRNVAGLLERFYPDPDYRRLVAGIHEGWHRNEHIRETELVASLKTGGQRTISWSTSRLRVGRGPTAGFIAVGVDVTTRRNLQQWVSLFQRSLQHLEEGVVLTDPVGTVLAWSSGAERMLGHADEVMQGRVLKDLYLRGERELIARTVDRAIEAQGQYGGEVELEHADGSTRILVFKQHRLDGDAGPLARLTLLSEPRLDAEMESRLADSQLLAVQLQEQVERDRTLIAERDRLIEELKSAANNSGAAAAEARTRVGELEQLLAATESAARDAQGRVAELEQALASVDAGAPALAAELEQALATSGEAATRARARVEELERALASSQAAAVEAESQVQQLERELAEALAAVDAASNRAERDATDTAVTLAIAQGEAADAQDALFETQTRLEEATARAVSAEQQVAGLEADLAMLAEQVAEVEEAAAAQVEEARVALEEATVKVTQAVAAAEDAGARVADLEAQLVEARRAADSGAAELAQAHQQAEARIAELENEAAQLTRQAEARRTQLESELAAARDVAATAPEAQARAEALQAELDETRQRADARTAELDARLAEARKQADELPAAEARIASLEEELHAAAARVGELEGELDGLRSMASGQEAELEAELDQLRAEAEDQVTNLQKALDVVRGQAAGRQAELDKTLEETSVRIAGLEAELEAARSGADAQQADAATQTGRVAELEAELAQAREAAEQREAAAAQDTGEATERAEALQDQLDEVRRAADELEARLRGELDDARRVSTDRIQELEAELEAARQRSAELEASAAAEAPEQAEDGEAESTVEEPTDAGDAPTRDARVVELEAELEELRAETEARQAELAEARADAEAKAAQLQLEVDRLQELEKTAAMTPVEEGDDSAARIAELESNLAEAKQQAAQGAVELALKLAKAQNEAKKLRRQLEEAAPAAPVDEGADAASEGADAASEGAGEASEGPELSAARAALAEAEQKLAEAEQRLAVAEEQLAAADEVAGRVPELEARIAELQQADEAAGRVPELEARIAELQQADEAAGRVPELEARIAELEQADEAAGRVPELEARIAELESAAEVPDPRIVELEAELAEARRKIEAQAELISAGEENRLAAENRAEEEASGRAEVQARLVDTDKRLGELEAQLVDARQTASSDGDDLVEARQKVRELEQQLTADQEAAEQRAAEAAEDWVQERSALEEQHRTDLADVQSRAADERKALEEQLSKDILAAEERAEADRQKLLDRHDQERKEWEDAAAIARAEAESRLRQELERLTARLEGAGNLQPYLARLEDVALAAADVEGRVFGWSGAASTLDVRDDLDALGAFLHKDVLRLDGVDWKTLLGKVVVEGSHSWSGTLVARGGLRREVELTATLVRDGQGKPIGVIEVLREPQLEGSLETHAWAAVAHLAMPLHGALETRAVAGLKNNQRTSAAVRDLLAVCRAVEAGESWEDVEGAARRVDLSELVSVSDGLVQRSEDAWRELRATVKDLQWLEDVVKAGATSRHRWNELVSRCLHAVEDLGGKRARRSLGNQVFIEGRGDQLVPLLVTLFGPIRRADGDVEVATSTGADHARVEVTGIDLLPDERRLASRLAALAGGQITDGPPLAVQVPLELPEEATAPLVEEVSGEETRPAVGPVAGPTLDAEETVPPSAGLDLSDLVDRGPGTPPEEEADRQTQPGMPSVLVADQDSGPEVLGAPEVEPLEAGEDAIMADPAEIEAALEEEGGSDLPDIDELEQLFDAAVGVSPSVLAVADEMEAYAAEGSTTSDDLADAALAAGQVPIPPSADVKTDAGMPRPAPPIADPKPAPAVPEDASITDTGDKMTAVVKQARKPARGRGRGKKKKKGSRSRKKRS